MRREKTSEIYTTMKKFFQNKENLGWMGGILALVAGLALVSGSSVSDVTIWVVIVGTCIYMMHNLAWDGVVLNTLKGFLIGIFTFVIFWIIMGGDGMLFIAMPAFLVAGAVCGAIFSRTDSILRSIISSSAIRFMVHFLLVVLVSIVTWLAYSSL